MAKILLIDNYDSFTYNLVQAFLTLGAEVEVHRNNEIAVYEAEQLKPTHLVISPGPGRPENAGVSLACIEIFKEKIPILGVCLGHQCIVEHFGGNVVYAKRLMHGKASIIKHDGLTIFSGLENSFAAGRYHSLAADRETLPEVLTVSAQTKDDEVMGVRHHSLRVEGVQFHPESVLTPNGEHLMSNFLKI
jgi:anthranilate synthase component 2/para-aminobenzoate synthetase component 2